MSALLFVAAVIAAGIGFGFAFSDPQQLFMFGDAVVYNRLVAVGRGALFVGSGAILAAMGVAALIHERLRRPRPR